VLLARADPFNALNRLNPLLLHIAGQNIEQKLIMGMPETFPLWQHSSELAAVSAHPPFRNEID